MNNIIEFKTPKLKEEFNDSRLDSRLKFIIYAIASYSYHKFGIILILTEVFRSQELQDFYYQNNENYKLNPWKSLHQIGQAVDFRTSSYKQIQLLDMKNYINNNILYNPIKFKTCLVHDIGHAEHGHIQVDNHNFTNIVKY